MSGHYHRALLLFNQDRFKEALTELQAAVAEDENDMFAHGLMAITLSSLDRHQQALQSARRAIEISPDSDYGHYSLARVYLDRSCVNEAFEAISTAVQIDPDDAMNHAWLARVEFERGNWNAAVVAADAGLELDAENDMCLHYRSMALKKLGRDDEARRDQETLLASDPNDPHTHAARGWTLLEEGKPEKAREHFLEALRLDPSIDYARVGLANALKAKHFIFGWALRGLLYLDRFRSRVIWIFMIGFFVGLRFLDRIAAANAGAVVPALLVKAVFFTLIVLIMVAQPLFGLILRLDRDGRRALSPDELRASNWHAVCLLLALGMGLLWALKGSRQMSMLAYPTAALTLAITNTFQATPGWVRSRMKWITLFAAFLIPLSFVLLIVAAVLLVKHKQNTVWLIKLSLIYLPVLSVCISAFSDNIAEFLEKRRPDAT